MRFSNEMNPITTDPLSWYRVSELTCTARLAGCPSSALVFLDRSGGRHAGLYRLAVPGSTVQCLAGVQPGVRPARLPHGLLRGAWRRWALGGGTGHRHRPASRASGEAVCQSHACVRQCLPTLPVTGLRNRKKSTNVCCLFQIF